MRAVGIKTLKNKLSEYVRLAAAGETVLISDRDQVVAQLGPPEAARSSALGDALLADAVRQGLLTPAALPPGPPPASSPVTRLAELLHELERDRSER
jgi:antitoxin (DNA-binding transcriptional repressor) of toxin-antitoxin stability system